jgi:hypothetical protein
LPKITDNRFGPKHQNPGETALAGIVLVLRQVALNIPILKMTIFPTKMKQEQFQGNIVALEKHN